MSGSSTNPKSYMKDSYVKFKVMGKRKTGFVEEVFDDGFAVATVVHDDRRFPHHKTDYVVFVKTEEAYQ